ncbi:MAG TPA: sigma 54-interacting transcriptional regulator [Planctomycetota bacterium]|nr:sigma 54-interacting transcriptional regulator [Planctomycetota bacterium]
MLELRIQFDGRNWTVPLSNGTHWRIGRAETCEVCIPDRRISSEHAELTLADGKLKLTRTKGQRPIEMGGKAVESAELIAGSCFVIGQAQFMVVTAQDGMNLIDAKAVLSGSWMGASSSDPTLAATKSSAEAPAVTAAAPVATSQATSMRLLAQLFSLLTRASDKLSLTNAVLELVCQRLNANRAVLARIEDAEHLKIIAARGLPQEAEIKSLISTTVLKKIIDERQAVFIGNTASGVGGIGRQESIVRNHIQAVACTPVLDPRGRLTALLYVDNQDRPSEFSAQDAELLVWLGQIYSLLEDNLEMRRRLEAEVTELKRSAVSAGQIIAEAPAMINLLERVKKAAVSEAAVLILGESGAGKECIARMLHQQSPRSAKAFVARNCAAVPENLFESEMFGHKKGSFTGAESDRKGAFLEADGGTLFLDEIGDLDYTLQTKLLRALQERVIRPVGSDRDIPVNVRIVCATNKDLRECCKNHTFREDLYYRLATVTLTVPPLRERREDIVPLARYFVTVSSNGARTLTPAAEERLKSYNWHGNVRELRSIIEQAVIFAAGNEIHPDELNLPTSAGEIELGSQRLEDIERRHILQVLQSCNNNKTEAAKVLGLARSTLVLKLQSYQQQ